MSDRSEKEKTRLIFEELPVPRALASLAVPTVVAQLTVLVYNIADTFFLGRTNDPRMVAGATLILPVFNLSFLFSNLAGFGGGSLISRLLGAGDYTGARKVFSFSAYLSALFALLFSVLTAVFMSPLLRLLGADSDTTEFARTYATCVIVLGGVPTILSLSLSTLLRSCGHSREAGIGITAGSLLNIALDPLFMFVLLPRGKEILGAGIATMLSNLCVCLFFLIVVFTSGRGSVPTLRPDLGIPDRESIRSVFSVGIPSALNSFFFDLDYIVIGRLMSAYGAVPLAAVGIVLKAERFPLNVGVGLCQGMMPLAGYTYSAGNYDRMSKTVRYSRRAGIVTAVVSIVLYELFAPQIMRFFIADPATVQIGAQFLRARCLATVFMFLSFHVVFSFEAFGKGETAFRLGVLRWAILNIPMLFLMNALFGRDGIVWAQLAADLICASVSLILFASFEKKLFRSAAETGTGPKETGSA